MYANFTKKSIASIRNSAFSLIELMVVISIVSILAALLFPTFLSVRGKARQVVCISNLRQIGIGMAMYQQDYDGYFPYAVDPGDKAWPYVWQPKLPQFAADILQVGLLHDLLQPYLKSPKLFHCPSDTGFTAIDYPAGMLDASSSSYLKFGTSYFYRTTLAACRSNEAAIKNPSKVTTVFDPVGFWHGTLTPIEPRYNMLFADGHVKNLTRFQADTLWGATRSFEGCSQVIETRDYAP